MLRTLFGIVAACLLPAPSAALTLIGTGTGIVYSATGDDVIDGYGAFGPAGASLLGKTATITIAVDLTATPPLLYGDGSVLVNSGAFNAYPGFDPLRTADIGGGAISIDGIERANDGASATSYALWAPGNLSCGRPTVCAMLGTATGPGRFGGTNSLSLSAGGFLSGVPGGLFDVPVGGNLCTRVTACIGGFSFDIAGEGLFGSVRLSSLSLSVADVPEPSTWTMMMLGFGAVGWGLRRRRGSTGGSGISPPPPSAVLLPIGNGDEEKRLSVA